MVAIANERGRNEPNVSFQLGSALLAAIPDRFDVVLSRHAPFSLSAVEEHLSRGGWFITQQVGEHNMANIKRALQQETSIAPIAPATFEGTGLHLAEFLEYDVEYVVEDVESLVFWLSALDRPHADVNGKDAVARADAFNAILRNNVTVKGFVTNEHRYAALARSGLPRLGGHRPVNRLCAVYFLSLF